ncbi:predicted protein [Brucella sp. 83/13]|nr:predicted protein [Brucella sp. 83/13]
MINELACHKARRLRRLENAAGRSMPIPRGNFCGVFRPNAAQKQTPSRKRQ